MNAHTSQFPQRRQNVFVQTRLAHSVDFERLDRWGRELEKAYPNVSVRRPILLAYEPRLMWDPIHLNSHGVEKFMPIVAQAVQEALSK